MTAISEVVAELHLGGTVSNRTFRDLVVWQRAMDLAVESYRLTTGFPPQERFGIVAQIRRAGSSIPANIAEGSGRLGTRELVHFLSIARGSARELETHFELASRLGMLTKRNATTALVLLDEVGRLLSASIETLRRRAARTVSPSRKVRR
jgi:four helix bundle protein